MNKCICGCGEETKGGKFRPGHDQKLRAALEDAAGGLEALREIVEKHLGCTVSTVKDGERASEKRIANQRSFQKNPVINHLQKLDTRLGNNT